MHGITLTKFDPTLDPVMTCFHELECQGTMIAKTAPKDLNDYVHSFGVCRSFMVPAGTTVRAYNVGGDEKFGTIVDSSYVTFVGSAPTKDYGELECQPIEDDTNWYAHRQELVRTEERPDENDVPINGLIIAQFVAVGLLGLFIVTTGGSMA